MRFDACCIGGAVFLLAGAAGCTSCEGPPRMQQVRVAAAADLRFALDELIAEFQKINPDVRAEVSYGSSGNFFAQLSSGAPFDVFLSADVEYPRRLAEQGNADPASLVVYAVGHLAVWVPDSCPVDVTKLGWAALRDPIIKKVAIANPRHAPYGRAAEAALKNGHVYDQVKEKLVLGENISQAAQFVQSGAADAGVIALSLALAPALRDAGHFWEVPVDVYPRLEQGGIILAATPNRPAAEALLGFLSKPEGKALLKRYGFFLPGE